MVAGLALVLPLAAQDLAGLQKEISDFRLPNGFHFTVAERHGAPVVAFNLFANVGSVNDPAGENGMAQLLQRLAFKGTETIGSKNWPAERDALQHMESLYDELEAARSRPFSNSTLVETLDGKLKAAIQAADNLGDPGAWKAIIAENGGTNLSATASFTYTEYRYSLPSNRAEAWFQLESQHFVHPVFREFYRERETMYNEVRAAEAGAQNRVLEDFAAAAFQLSPYRNPSIGWSGTIMSIRLAGAKAFYEKYYTPANVEIAIVGDITAAEAKRLAEKYFGSIPSRVSAPAVRVGEPAQPGPKTISVNSNSPLVVVGYKRPAQYEKDDVAFDILSAVLVSGHSGALYRDLVTDKHLATTVEAVPTFPDGRYPSLFVFLIQPAPGHTGEELVAEVEAVMGHLAAGDVDDPDMTRAKARLRAGVMDLLATNEGLVSILPRYVADFNEWTRLVTVLDLLNKVSVPDLQRAAGRYFNPMNRTLAISGVAK